MMKTQISAALRQPPTTSLPSTNTLHFKSSFLFLYKRGHSTHSCINSTESYTVTEKTSPDNTNFSTKKLSINEATRYVRKEHQIQIEILQLQKAQEVKNLNKKKLRLNYQNSRVSASLE